MPNERTSNLAKTDLTVTYNSRQVKYGKSVFLAIAGDALTSFLDCREQPGIFDDRTQESFRIDERGVWVHPDFDGLAWTYLCETDAALVKNPLDEPALPFEFTAAELAAFMLDGVGYFVRERWGGWSDGPDPLALQGLGVQGGKARQALQSAYELFREAEQVIGHLDERYLNPEDLDERFWASHLKDQARNQQPDSYSAHRNAMEAVKSRPVAQRDAASEEQAKWRKRMVHELLRPSLVPVGLPQQAVQRQPAQEAAILAKLAALGVDPQAVPPAPPGKKSLLKQKVRAELGYTDEVMNKAWKRLRKDGRIKDAA